MSDSRIDISHIYYFICVRSMSPGSNPGLDKCYYVMWLRKICWGGGRKWCKVNIGPDVWVDFGLWGGIIGIHELVYMSTLMSIQNWF